MNLRKLAKYLKPFMVSLLLIMVLLIGRVLCDLKLPDYMSRIVNIGIQRGGIEDAAPDVISSEGFELIGAFMNERERELLSECYTLKSVLSRGEAGKSYADLYPKAGERLYVKQKLEGETSLALDRAFGSAVWTMIYALGGQASEPEEGSAAEETPHLKMPALSELYTYFTALETLPSSELAAAREKAAAVEETVRLQGAVEMTRALYAELGADTKGMTTSYIMRVGLQMLAVTLLGGTANILVSLLSSRAAAGFSRNLRRDLLKKIQTFSSGTFERFSSASLITRCTNDVTQLQMVLMIGVRIAVYAPMMGIGGIFLAVRKSLSMSWVIALACIILVGLISIIMSIAMPKFKMMQQLLDRLNLVARENLSGLLVVRAFGTQEHERERFDRENRNLTDTSLFIYRVMILMEPIMMLIMNGTTVLIVWVGAGQIAQSSMQVGDMMAFMQYAMQIIMAFLMLSMMFTFLPRATVSAGRVADVLETEDSITDPPAPKSFDPAQKGVVEFRGVHFRYPGAEEDALSDISFTAEPGQTTAIIGSTGSGKSTVANLLLRFFDVSRGQILVEGTDIRQVRQKELRKRLGYVPQEGVLLSGTVASNIGYGNRGAGPDEIETAASVAQAADFISQLPGGFEAEISQGGTNVSGGQRQRLSIARALAKKPSILIFDDSFSALDFKTDSALRKALRAHTGDSTVILVAQRVNTILYAEQIIVLDEGKIVGRGTHRQLLESCPQYYEIAASQLSQEELA